MIRVFLTFDSLINHHRQIKQRQWIEHNQQPIGSNRRVQGKEEKESNDTTSEALEKKHQDSPNQTWPSFVNGPSYNQDSHAQQ